MYGLVLFAWLSLVTQPFQTRTHPVEGFHLGIAAFNKHDLDTFMQQFAPDIEITPNRLAPGARRRPYAVRRNVQAADVRMEIEELRVREPSQPWRSRTSSGACSRWARARRFTVSGRASTSRRTADGLRCSSTRPW